jgi:capsular polysaccharide biosynthesis protein
MELILIGRVLLRRWWLVVIPVAIVAVFVVSDFLNNRTAVSGGYTVSLRYSAAQVLEAIPNRDGDYQDVWLASELTVNALTDWVRTSSFLSEVDQEVRARGAAVSAAAIGIAADNKRSVGVLTLTYPEAETLQAIAQAAVNVLKNRAQVYFPQLGGQAAQVTILDVPQVVPAPPPLTNRLAPFIRLGIGLLTGIGLAFLAEYLDPTLRRREQVEALGLPVIVTLPRDRR